MWTKSLVFLIVILIFSSCATAGNTPPTLMSPTLEILRGKVQEGDANATSIFWQKIKREGAPLFESIPGNENEVYCTFLYRSENKTDIKSVFVSIPTLFLLGGRHVEQWEMDQLDLGQQKIWFKTITVRSDIRAEYRFAPNESLSSMEAIYDSDDFGKSSKHWKLDPFNKEIFQFPSYSVSVLVGPKATPQPYVQKRSDVPVGLIKKHQFKSNLLKGTEQVYVYTPPGYHKDKGPYHFLFVFDGSTYTSTVPTPTILDNLLADGLIPPMVTVLVDDDNSRITELTPNGKFPQFIREELLPWLRQHYAITIDPKKSFIAGSSLGGLAATWNAFKSPDLFGNVLSQSGCYFWFPDFNEESENPVVKEKFGWLIHQFQNHDRLPINFYIDVGLLEDYGPPQFGINTNLIMNRRMRDTLQSKGYPLKYVEFSGGHEYLWWQQTLADGLIALLKMGK